MTRPRNLPAAKVNFDADCGSPISRPPRFDGYIRISYLGRRSGPSFISPRLQEAKIRQYAAAHGYELDRIFSDLNRSGRDENRAGLQCALARIENGQSGGLIVARLDRLGRGAGAVLGALAAIDAAGAKLVSVEDGFNSQTPFGKALSTILLALAELELARLADSARLARRHAVGRGVHPSSYPPTGYRRGPSGRLEPDPHQGPLVAAAFELRAAGATYTQVAQFLEGAGVVNAHGNRRWYRKTVYQLFQNPVYVGEAYAGSARNVSAHPPLVRRAVWLAAHAASASARANAHGQTLLAGLVRCGGCCHALGHSRYSTRLNPSGSQRRYHCHGHFSGGACTAPAYSAATALEHAVVEAFLAQLQARRPRRDLDTALRAAEQRLAAADVLAHSHPGWRSAYSDTADGAVAAARAEVLALWRKRQLAQLPSAASLRRSWPGMSQSERRQVLCFALDAVIVFRGRQPIEERIRLLFAGAPRDWYPKMGAQRPLRPFEATTAATPMIPPSAPPRPKRSHAPHQPQPGRTRQRQP